MSVKSAKLYEFLRREGGELFSEAHAIYTPQPLVEEIISQINTVDKSILVLFNMEFVVSLVYTAGVDPANITVYVDHTNKAKFAERMGVKYITNLDEDMKFDVVIGNPPYQDSTAKSSKKAWPSFVVKSFELLSKDGCIGMITPASWMNGVSPVFELIKNNQCVYLYTNISKYFPSVGSTFSAYIIKNCPRTEPTITDVGLNIDFETVTALPKNISAASLSIIQKFSSSNNFCVVFDSFCHSQRRDRTSDKQTPEFKFPNKHGSSSILWSNEEHPCAKKKKVMFYMSGNPKPFYDEGKYGISQHHGYIEVGSEQDGNNLVKFITSKLAKFFITHMNHGQAWNKNILNMIPVIDLSRTWTDAELYQHFGLTQDEIDYVEASVK